MGKGQGARGKGQGASGKGQGARARGKAASSRSRPEAESYFDCSRRQCRIIEPAPIDIKKNCSKNLDMKLIFGYLFLLTTVTT